MKDNKKQFENEKILNLYGKELINEMSISSLAKAITVETFRNGPIEDMHAEGKLSDEDMKILNKHMVNKIARLIKLVEEEDYFVAATLLNFALACTHGWDEPEIDMEEVEKIKSILFKDGDMASFVAKISK